MEKKVLFYLKSLGNGRRGRLASSLANALAEAGMQVSVLKQKSMPEEYELGEQVVDLGDLQKETSAPKKKLQQVLQQVDTVITFHVLTAKQILEVKPKNCRCLLVDTCWPELDYPQPKKFLGIPRKKKMLDGTVQIPRDMAKAVYEGVHQVLVFTEETRDFWNQQLPGKCKTVDYYYGDSWERLSHTMQQVEKLTPQNLPKRIIMVGAFGYGTGQLALVKAFEKILETNPDYELKLYGAVRSQNYYLQVMEYLRGHRLTEKVTIAPWKASLWEEQMPGTIFVHPGVQSPFREQIARAMAEGMPVLMSEHPDGSGKDLLEDGDNGLFFEQGNEKELEIGIKKYLAFPEERIRIAKQAVARLQCYDRAKVIDEWLKLL